MRAGGRSFAFEAPREYAGLRGQWIQRKTAEEGGRRLHTCPLECWLGDKSASSPSRARRPKTCATLARAEWSLRERGTPRAWRARAIRCSSERGEACKRHLGRSRSISLDLGPISRRRLHAAGWARRSGENHAGEGVAGGRERAVPFRERVDAPTGHTARATRRLPEAGLVLRDKRAHCTTASGSA